MKAFNIGWVFIAAILFSACGAHYNNEPTQRFTDQIGKFLPLNDSLLNLEKAGFVHINRTVDGNPLIQDSLVKLSPTWWQASEWAKEDGTYPWFWILLVLGPAVAYAIYYFSTRKRDAQWWTFLIIILAWGVIWVGAYCVLDSKRWSSDISIKVSSYDSVMQKDGDTHALWQNVKPL